MRYLFVFFCCWIFSLTLFSQKIQRVSGTFTYYAEGDVSLNQAKQKALEGAKLQAIAKAFGTVITQSTVSSDKIENGQEDNYFLLLNDSEVKGEWVEDMGDPNFQIEYAQEMLIVKCTVHGRAQEITNTASDFEATLLRNGTEPRFADTRFHNGDDMFLRFRSPVSGYVAVYLIDETPTAYCLLPYMDNAGGQQPVRHNEEYVFFSSQNSKTDGVVDEFTLTCKGNLEYNRLYVIFSPVPFTKALDDQMDKQLPRQLSYEGFNSWLGKCRRHDPKMGVKVMHIEITK